MHPGPAHAGLWQLTVLGYNPVTQAGALRQLVGSQLTTCSPKLKLRDRVAAVVYAFEHDLVSPAADRRSGMR